MRQTIFGISEIGRKRFLIDACVAIVACGSAVTVTVQRICAYRTDIRTTVFLDLIKQVETTISLVVFCTLEIRRNVHYFLDDWRNVSRALLKAQW